MVNTPSLSEAENLSPYALAKSDPLLAFVVRTHLSPIILGIAYSLGTYLLRLLAAWGAGHLNTAGGVTGYMEDLGLYTRLVYSAALWTYYAWIPSGIVEVIKGLVGNRVVQLPARPAGTTASDDGSLASFVAEMQLSFSNRWPTLGLLLLAAVAYFGIQLPSWQIRGATATIATPLSLVLSSVVSILDIYIVLRLLLCCSLGIYWFWQIFKRFKVNVRPLHPDRAGGLSPLGNFALRLSYLMALHGVLLVLAPITRSFLMSATFGFRFQPDILVGLGIYTLIAPAVFFAPLAVAHSSMRLAKERLLLQIDEKYEVVLGKIQKTLGDDVCDLEADLKSLTELQSLHAVAKEFPVWPFNLENLARFGTTYFIPVFLGFAANALTNLLMSS